MFSDEVIKAGELQLQGAIKEALKDVLQCNLPLAQAIAERAIVYAADRGIMALPPKALERAIVYAADRQFPVISITEWRQNRKACARVYCGKLCGAMPADPCHDYRSERGDTHRYVKADTYTVRGVRKEI